MRDKKDIIFLILACLIFLIAANVYNLKTDVFGAPDEFSHFEYIRYLNLNYHLPVYIDKITFWEAHQPPFYYLLLSPIDLILKNKITISSEVRLLRFCSSLLSVLTIMFAFFIAKTLFKNERLIYYSITLLFAFWPMFLFISGVLNNDNLVNLLGVVMLYLLVKYNTNAGTKSADIRITNADLLICGMIAGLAILTKMTLYPAALFFLAFIFWNNRYNLKNYFRFCLLPAAIILLIWVIRNLIFIGDAWGLKYANKFWQGQYKNLLEWQNFWVWMKDLTMNFWGVFGQANIGLEQKYYDYFIKFIVFILLLSPIILIFYFKKDKQIFKSLLICLLFFVILFNGVFYYSLEKYQPQGRYLLSGLFCIVLLIILTLFWLMPKKNYLIIPYLIILCLTIVNYNAFKQIDWKNARREVVLAEGKNDLLSKKWLAKSGKWKKKNNYYIYKKKKNNSYLLSDANLRLDTNEINKIFFKLKSKDFKRIKLSWKYFGERDFSEENVAQKKIKPNNRWQRFKIKFKNLKENDLIQIVKIELDKNKTGKIKFDAIRIQ